jgi:hypothetical protein
MEKFFNAVCWIGVGILVIFGLAVFVYRAIAIAYLTVWMGLFSSLPWWERILAPAAVIAGIAFLVRRSGPYIGRRIPPNRNFAYFTSRQQEKQSQPPEDL